MSETSRVQPGDASAQGVGRPETVQAWRKQVIQGILVAMVVLGGIAVVGAAYDAYVGQVLWQIPIILGAYVLLLLMLWRRVPYAVQAGVLLFLVYGLGVFNLFISGQLGDGFPFLLALPVLAALLFGRRMGIVSLLVATGTLIAFGWAFVSGILVVPPQEVPQVTELGSWLSRIPVFVMLVLLLMIPQNFLFQRLVDALTRSRDLARQLEIQQAGLEDAVAERTADLVRRSAQLQAAADVARHSAVIQDVQRLLEETVHLVSERFGFYHTGVFLLDQTGEYAVLRAASSEGGRRMLARGHRLRVGQVGIVGYVTGEGEPRTSLDVGEDAVYFDNPDLPETRSEAALPLRARGEVIGALDVQSTELGAFAEEDVAALQTLADQVAVAISNARLFQQVQESLVAERRAYGELSLEGWRELIYAQPTLEQRYDPLGLLPADGRWRPEMRQAVREGQPVVGRDGVAATMAIPLKVRERVIGVLDARKPAGGGDWTPEEAELLQTLVEQLGIALDGARLYQDMQRRAFEDRLVGEITARMRQTLDADAVLQTAIREIGQALGVASVEIRLGGDLAGDGEGIRPEKDRESVLDKEKEYVGID